MTNPTTLVALCLAASAVLAAPAAAQIFSTPLLQENAGRPAADAPLGGLDGVVIEQKLDQDAALDVELIDQDGKTVTFGTAIAGGKPVLMLFIFSECKSTCNAQLDLLAQELQKVEFTAGKDYRLISVSLDPDETPEKAKDSRDRYLAQYLEPVAADQQKFDRAGADWTFLVGTEANVRRLADSIGYGYRFVDGNAKIAHYPALIFLTPTGRIARYIGGLVYEPLVVKMSLFEAGRGAIGDVWDSAFTLCFYYDPLQNSYVPFATNFMMAGGAITVALLGWFLWRMRRFEVARRKLQPAEVSS